MTVAELYKVTSDSQLIKVAFELPYHIPMTKFQVCYSGYLECIPLYLLGKNVRLVEVESDILYIIVAEVV